MPIEIATEIKTFNQSEFHALAAKLLRVVFDVHNEFGRFLDEALYKNEIAARWNSAGFGEAQREVRISVSFETFRKDYFMDLLFNRGLMLEAKTAEALSPVHRSQGLNYLFLAGMKHALLANLRPESVEHEYLSTTLTHNDRREFTIVDAGWQAINEESVFLREKLSSLLADWGAFLEVNLYRDAITHFLGSADKVVRRIEVFSRGRLLGNQSVHLLSHDTAFAFTAIPKRRASMHDHQFRFLKHTPLRYIQWVNFNRHKIEFTTLDSENPTIRA
jgi:GxxExxY protein